MPALETVTSLLDQYQYWILFPIAIAEGPIIAVISGFLVSLGQLDLLPAFSILVAGDVLGDIFYYFLGYWSRGNTIPRWLSYIGITQERVAALEEYFTQYGTGTILFSKTQPIGSAILFSAGFARMPFRKYITYNVIGSIPKVALLGLIGFYFGEAYVKINRYLDFAAIASLLIALLLLLLTILFKRYLKKTHVDPNV